jgi:hypothetical protein
MEEVLKNIERGKQVGQSKKIEKNGLYYWFDSAIQKYKGNYRVHISLIKDENIQNEQYDILFTREFENFNAACQCIESYNLTKVTDFSTIKGQKIFNPEFLEEND